MSKYDANAVCAGPGQNVLQIGQVCPNLAMFCLPNMVNIQNIAHFGQKSSKQLWETCLETGGHLRNSPFAKGNSSGRASTFGSLSGHSILPLPCHASPKTPHHHHVLFCSVLFCSVLSRSVSCCSAQANSIQFCFVLFNSVLFRCKVRLSTAGQRQRGRRKRSSGAAMAMCVPAALPPGAPLCCGRADEASFTAPPCPATLGGIVPTWSEGRHHIVGTASTIGFVVPPTVSPQVFASAPTLRVPPSHDCRRCVLAGIRPGDRRNCALACNAFPTNKGTPNL